MRTIRKRGLKYLYTRQQTEGNKPGMSEDSRNVDQESLKRLRRAKSLRSEEQELVEACASKDLAEATKLLENGADPNVREASSLRRTPLHIACANGWLEFVKLLIEMYQCDPDIADAHSKRRTPLNYAIMNDRIGVVKYLLNMEGYIAPGKEKPHQQLDFNYLYNQADFVWYLTTQRRSKREFQGEYNRTPLHYASMNGHINMVQYLISEYGCSPDAKDNAGLTPLDFAWERQHTRIIRNLLAKVKDDVDPNLRYGPLQTSLEKACKRGYVEVVKYLVGVRGCDPILRDVLNVAWRNKKVVVVEYLIRQLKSDPNSKDGPLQTSLLNACKGGHYEIVKCLVEERHCDPYLNGDMSPLLYAWDNMRTDVAQYLISVYTGDPNVKNGPLQMSLCYACRYGHLYIVKNLVQNHHCDPKCSDELMRTPLHYASQNNHLDIVQYLVEIKCCNSNAKDSSLRTPIHYACICGYEGLVKYFKEHGHCDLSALDEDGLAPLHYACVDMKFNDIKNKWNGLQLSYVTDRLNTVLCLVGNSGCDLNIKSKHGLTPLHYACWNGYQKIVECLIKHGRCDLNAVDENGQTALHYACKYKRTDIVELLITKLDKCDPDIKDNNQMTALHYTCWYGWLDKARYLCEHGCNPNTSDKDGQTPLHYACKNHHTDIVQYLVSDEDCDPGIRDKYQQTALHCSVGNPDIVNLLLCEGRCDPNPVNSAGKTPLQLAKNPSVIRALIQYGANPTNVYETHGRVLGTEQPLDSLIKVFVLGNPSVGKSTLTAALKNESGWLLIRLYSSFRVVSGVDEKTAGIIPHEFESGTCGRVTVYDFAGQREFYNSHAALLQNAICFSPPVFLLVVDIHEPDDDLKQTIRYWISFIDNQCTSVSSKPHVIIVGSHADILQTEEYGGISEKLSIIDSLQVEAQFSNVHFAGAVALDSRYAESQGMRQFRRILKQSCDTLRIKDTISFSAHCFIVYVLEHFPNETAVTLKQVRKLISQKTVVATDKEVSYFLSDSPSALSNLCDELNDRGHVLYLRNPDDIRKSWIILNRPALLSEVTGSVFAPEHFKQHCDIASSTGVVPLSSIEKQFPHYNPDMVVGFLSHLEFCCKISDQETLQLISDQPKNTPNTDPNESYYFFPALVRCDAPENIWDSTSKQTFSYRFSWTLQCSEPNGFYSSRFVQVLLLRLAFSFAFPQDGKKPTGFPALQRKCSIWKNGIHWGNRSGVEALVEVIDNKCVNLGMCCSELKPECLQLRSQIMQKIFSARQEFCGKVDTTELFIDPGSGDKHPLESLEQPVSFSLNEVATAIVSGESHITSSTGKPFPLDVLLSFEPYAHLGNDILRELFTGRSKTYQSSVENRFLSQIAEKISQSDNNSNKKDLIIKLFKPNPSILAERISRNKRQGVVVEIFCVLEIWNDSCNRTYKCLREKLDQISIFAGRNPLSYCK